MDFRIDWEASEHREFDSVVRQEIRDLELEDISDLVFHVVTLDEDINDRSIFVAYGGDNNVVASYHAKTEWVTMDLSK